MSPARRRHRRVGLAAGRPAVLRRSVDCRRGRQAQPNPLPTPVSARTRTSRSRSGAPVVPSGRGRRPWSRRSAPRYPAWPRSASWAGPGRAAPSACSTGSAASMRSDRPPAGSPWVVGSGHIQLTGLARHTRRRRSHRPPRADRQSQRRRDEEHEPDPNPSPRRRTFVHETLVARRRRNWRPLTTMPITASAETASPAGDIVAAAWPPSPPGTPCGLPCSPSIVWTASLRLSSSADPRRRRSSTCLPRA